LERVEILRGSSAEFGGASSVTVNLVMKKALPKRSTAIRAAVGLRGSEPNVSLSWTENGGEGSFGWTLPVALIIQKTPSKIETMRQDAAAGIRSRWQIDNDSGINNFREIVITPRMTWKDGADTFTLSPLFFDGLWVRNKEMTQSAYTNAAAGTGLIANGDRNSHEENSRRTIRLRVEGEKHLDEIKFSGRASINNSGSTSDITRLSHDASNVATSTIENTASNENELNMALRLDKPIEEHLIAIGLEHINLKRTEDQNLSGTPSAYQAQERQSIAWIQDDWMLQPNVTLTYGVRGETIDLKSTGVSQQHGQVMPSLAIRWEPMDKWVMRTSLGAGLKMPKLDEISNAATLSLTTNTPVEADRRGNPSLKPERSLNYEAVLERYLDQDSGVLGANLYVRTTQDFTERRVQQESGRWIDRPQNEGDATHWGIELDGKVRMDNFGWKGATIKSHLTLPNAKIQDTRLGITRMARDTPKYVLSAGLDGSLPSLTSSYGISTQISGKSETDIPGEQRGYTQARTTLDAFWLYKLTPQFNLRFSGQNLLATDTERDMIFTSGTNTYQLHTLEDGHRTLIATIEGRW